MKRSNRVASIVMVLGSFALLAQAGETQRTDRQPAPLAFYDIVPYAPGREAATARDIREANRTAGLETFLYCVSLDPQGVPAFAKVEEACRSFRRLKAELKDSPVKLGFLLQSILGHWPRVDKDIEPWQRSVNEKGDPKRFCILDARFCDYIRRTGAALAAEKPCFILSDDDVRAFTEGGMECFCPLHTAEFNRRAGTSFTPGQYRAAIAAGSQPDDRLDGTNRLLQICADLRDEIPMTVVRHLRAGIDSVDPTLPGGVCLPGAETVLAAERAKVMAGKGNPPTLRLANSKYAEFVPADFAGKVVWPQAFIDFYTKRGITRFLDESDTYPHTRYARSGRTFAAKLALSVFIGLRGAKIWLVGMHKDVERVPECYDRALGENKRRFETLAADLDGSKPVGVRIPAFELPPRLHVYRGGCHDDMFWDLVWTEKMLSFFGIPFYGDFSRAPGDPILLTGTGAAHSLTPAELDEIFRGKVFVDGPASLELAQRGRADALGCVPVADDRAFNSEFIVPENISMPFAKWKTIPALTRVDASAGVASELHYTLRGVPPTAASRVAAGSVVFTNKTGGVVFTASFDPASNWGFNTQNLRRRSWLVRALRALDPDFPVTCENLEPNLTIARRGRDGRTYVFTLDLSFDDMENLRYRTARPMADAELLGADGVWRKPGVVREGADWTLPVRLPCMGFAIVRF